MGKAAELGFIGGIIREVFRQGLGCLENILIAEEFVPGTRASAVRHPGEFFVRCVPCARNEELKQRFLPRCEARCCPAALSPSPVTDRISTSLDRSPCATAMNGSINGTKTFITNGGWPASIAPCARPMWAASRPTRISMILVEGRTAGLTTADVGEKMGII